jgi:hypothetical protein
VETLQKLAAANSIVHAHENKLCTFHAQVKPTHRPRRLLSPSSPPPKLKLLDQMREVMRLKHYSLHTELS